VNTPESPRRVVAALVDRGLLPPDRGAEALAVVTPLLAGPGEAGPASPPVRRRLAEITGYVGAAFVVGAAVLFLSTAWDDLGPWTQVVLLGASALVLAAAGAVVVRSAPAGSVDPVRRRLASVLHTGAAGCTAFAVGVAVGRTSASEEVTVLVAATGGLLAALAGYRAAPSAVGQLGAAVAAVVMLPSGLGALDSEDPTIVWLALALVALGGLWTVAATRGWWRETDTGRAVGCLVALVGAQLPILAGDQVWAGYVLTGGIALAAFAGYLVSRAWVHLATGVVAVTLVVPEALQDAFDESLGAAGVLLVAGVTLLGAGLLGLRLRHEVSGP
jgi:hypothetical protein